MDQWLAVIKEILSKDLQRITCHYNDEAKRITMRLLLKTDTTKACSV